MAEEKSSYFKSLLIKQGNGDSREQDKVDMTDGDVLLNLILPLPMSGSVFQYSKESHSYVTVIENDSRYTGNVTEMLAGSVADGLALPQLTHLSGENFRVELPDFDMKYSFGALIVDPYHKRAFARADPEGCPPGFVKLKLNPEWFIKRRVKFPADLFQHDMVKDWQSYTDQDGFISRPKFVHILRHSMRMVIHSVRKELRQLKSRAGAERKVSFSLHGPAVSADTEDSISHLTFSKDYVVSLPCPRWPEQAADWPNRERVWPPNEVVRKVLKGGCFIVPKTHRVKVDPRHFLLSFSMSDVLVSQALSINQRRCYMLFKFLFKLHLNKAKRGLATFFCKTTLFWLCERVPQSQWREDNPVQCLMWLISDLEGYLEKHNLPHFFIADENLIDHLSPRVVAAILRDVRKAKVNPCEILLDLTEKHRFCWLSRDVSLKKLLQPFPFDCQLNRSLIRVHVLRFVSTMLDKGNIYLASAMLCGLESCEVVPTTERCIACLEEILGKGDTYMLKEDSEEKTDSVCLRGLLANVYHQRAEECAQNGNEEESEKYMSLSHQTFTSILDVIGYHIWIYGAFYDYLIASGMNATLVRHFLSEVHCKGRNSVLYEGGVYNAITPLNRLTTESPSLYSFTDEFLIPSTAYILFKVLLGYFGMSDNAVSRQEDEMLFQQSVNVVQLLDKWAMQKSEWFSEDTDEFLCYIVASANMMIGDSMKGQVLFNAAVNYNFTFGKIDAKTVDASSGGRKGWRFFPYGPKDKKAMDSRSSHRFRSNRSHLKFRTGAVRITPFKHY